MTTKCIDWSNLIQNGPSRGALVATPCIDGSSLIQNGTTKGAKFQKPLLSFGVGQGPGRVECEPNSILY